MIGTLLGDFLGKGVSIRFKTLFVGFRMSRGEFLMVGRLV